MANKQTFPVLFVFLAGLSVSTATGQAQEENNKIGSFTDPMDGLRCVIDKPVPLNAEK